MNELSTKPLDFAVIGASKSGTTTLFQLLRQHPRLFVPPEKDAPFFANDEWFARGWAWAVNEFFAGAPPDAAWGTITPTYMEDPRVPERIARTFPAVKLVAILRNPIDRAFSQFRQQVRLGKEPRTFERAVDDQLRPGALEQARANETRTASGDAYVVYGEYGRILGRVLTHFPPERLHVTFTELLERSPDLVLDGLLAHLGLPGGFRPPGLGARHHEGGSRQRFPNLVQRASQVGPLRFLWHRLSGTRRRAILRWYFTSFNVVPDPPPVIDAAVRRRLVEHFRPDVRALEAIVGRPAPWPEYVGD